MRLALLPVFAALVGCVSPMSLPDPTERAARTLGLERRLVEGAGFRHLVWIRGDPASARHVHVYLEGDGTPWLDRRRVAADPGPRHPLVPPLMALDPTPSILVGRPCYHGLARSTGCSPWLWTHGRYGEPVVVSLARAIERVLPAVDDRELVLIGHSGGGTLAVLLAPRLKGVTAVVTLAANLDVRAWSEHHGYSVLSGSLDPAEEPPLDPCIRQIHLRGERDDEVPLRTLTRYRARHPQAQVEVVVEVDHRRGWVERWPALLESVWPVVGSGRTTEPCVSGSGRNPTVWRAAGAGGAGSGAPSGQAVWVDGSSVWHESGSCIGPRSARRCCRRVRAVVKSSALIDSSTGA